MLFGEPTSLTTALRVLAEKTLLPTSLGTNELRGIAKDIRAKAVFSARTMSLDYLDEIKEQVSGMLAGTKDLATARLELQQKLRKLGYSRKTGFPGQAAGEVPEAAEGSLQDLASDQRIDLVLDTNLRMAANKGEEIDGNSEEALWQFPAWELVRFFDREVPRGFERRGGDLVLLRGDSWPERWARAGGKLAPGQRMVARKDDPIWGRLGDSGIFADGTDSEVPPYAFHSGYDRVEVGRAEALKLGVIAPEEEVGRSEATLAGKLFEDPAAATLGDLEATRQELLAAARKYREAA